MDEKCKHKPVERPGLYMMVFFILVQVWGTSINVTRLEKKVDEIGDAIANQSISAEASDFDKQRHKNEEKK
jgi:hypothetical protein